LVAFNIHLVLSLLNEQAIIIKKIRFLYERGFQEIRLMVPRKIMVGFLEDKQFKGSYIKFCGKLSTEWKFLLNKPF